MNLLLSVFLIFGFASQGTHKKPGLSSKEKVQAKAILKRYFKESNQGARTRILAELEPLDHPSKRDISYFRKLCFRWTRIGPRQVGKSPVTCTDPAYPGKYIMQVPSKARKGAKVGLFISLHGGGDGVGSGSQIQGLFGTPGPRMINVYPTVTQKTTAAWNTKREEQYVLAIIRELKRTYYIDTNRIYIAGHSMGGFGTWSIAGRHPDLFAAASAMAGGTYGGGVIPNFKNLPLWVYHSTDDPKVGAASDIKAADTLAELKKRHGAYDFVWKLYDDIGHGLPKGGVKPIFKWMLSKTRIAYPNHIIWQPSRSYKRLFYWLRLDAKHARTIEAKHKGNEFRLRGARSGMWVYLNDKMCKLAKPIVVHNDDTEVFRGTVPYSLVALVDSIGRKSDPEMYFTARIRIP